ncbi:amidohydrolase family protein [Portibacter lacus]|uniref:Amidohydrolase n=1 Tax=Portibacter lacus TaxID=1099794 RepID=A0AA37SS16_9BACT|nr:amidohydrolase family protein [Portibacter lacus]GLR17105.1 amidohydrolase [Portibacter lacus]
MKYKFWVFIALMFSTFSIGAQDVDIKLSSTYAIQNAHIIQKPGKSIEKGTLIIKDGVIIDVGTNVSIPADAILVKGDSMYVYPGFIDAYNNIGEKKKEEKKNEEKIENPGNPPNDRAGITPERSLSEVFDGGDKSIAEWREAGFTASLSAPSDGMLPGKASIIIHSGHDASSSILKENMGTIGTFQSANRIYPATIIGVMAKYRDLFRQTSYAMKHESAYKANPIGMARPAYNKSLMALIPVVDKSQYLYMEAEKLKDISHALTLQKDLGFNIALVNVKQGGQYIDVIKSQKMPLVLSLDIPESKDKKDKEKDGDKKEKGEKEKDKKDEDKEKKELDPEVEAMKVRRDKAIMEYQSQAALFAKNGIEFGFSGKDIKGKDVKKNVKIMMEQGITEDQILTSLTLTPAKMLGVSNVLGSLEKGKIANLFIATAPYFDEDSKIKYVFVEGEQFEYEVKKKKAKQEGKEGTITGLYACTIDVPGDQRNITISIAKSDDSYTLIIENEGDEKEIDDFTIDGNRVSFPMEINEDGFTMKLKYDFTIDAGEIDGSVIAGEFGSFPLKGERTGDPKL